eukprot:5436332-Amphidinium_carterae.1
MPMGRHATAILSTLEWRTMPLGLFISWRRTQRSGQSERAMSAGTMPIYKPFRTNPGVTVRITANNVTVTP